MQTGKPARVRATGKGLPFGKLFGFQRVPGRMTEGVIVEVDMHVLVPAQPF
jgi:hypothetical protein